MFYWIPNKKLIKIVSGMRKLWGKNLKLLFFAQRWWKHLALSVSLCSHPCNWRNMWERDCSEEQKLKIEGGYFRFLGKFCIRDSSGCKQNVTFLLNFYKQVFFNVTKKILFYIPFPFYLPHPCVSLCDTERNGNSET